MPCRHLFSASTAVVRWSAIVGVALALAMGAPASAQSPSVTPSPAIGEVELSPDAAFATWFQIEYGEGGDVLWVGRATGRADDVVRTAGAIGAAVVTSTSEGTQVLAWWPDGLGGILRRFAGDGSVLPVLETDAPIAAATVSGDGRRVVWASTAEDGSIDGVRRRNLNQHANQDVVRLAGALAVTDARLFADRRGDQVILAGTDPSGATAAWLLRPDASPVPIPVAPDGTAIGLMDVGLVFGPRAADGTAGPPFAFVELPSMATTTLDAGPGDHAIVTRDGWLAWETPEPDETRAVMTLGAPDDEPALAWTWDPTGPGGDRHLVGATADAGYGGERWAALYPDGLPYQGPGADPVAEGGRFAMLPNRATATTAAILPPVREGRPWAPILASDEPIQIEAAAKVSDGFVAVGRRTGTEGVAMWRSTDGKTWRAQASPIPPDLDIGSLQLFSRGSTVILAGGENGVPPNRVRLWTSEDAGHTWTAVPDGPMFGAGPVGRSELAHADAGVWDVGRLGGRYAVLGAFCVESCERPTLWTSKDLRTWSRTPVRSRIDGATSQDLTGLTLGRDRLLATFWPDGTGTGPRLAASDDGRRWTELGVLPDAPDGHMLIESRAGITLVASAGDDDGPLTIWQSRDGRNWDQAYQDASAWGVVDVVASGGWSRRIVVVGWAELDREMEDGRNAVVVSVNGRPWERSVGWMNPTNSRPGLAVFSGSRQVLVLGSSDGGGLPAGWRTELPSDPTPGVTP